jgi:3-deoxy-manno-octulosonate cytidylyltransferase (CMP-KDO synthetase)
LAACVVIPARFGSTRFPAKILASETGRPLVQHVVDRVRKCRRVREIIVATDDQRIVEALTPFGTRCVMTDARHFCGTDRISEVARDLPDEITVNVQGDEPEIEPEVVDGLIGWMEASRHSEMATAATAFPAGADPQDPNLVKVVTDLRNRAIYFSRSAIPYRRDATQALPVTYRLHLGIYAYRRDFLLKFTGWPTTPLEQIEKLEQLRALEYGAEIFVLEVTRASHGIDTPEQYAEFVARTRQLASSAQQ